MGSFFVKPCGIAIIWDWPIPTVVAGQRIGAKGSNDNIHEELETAERGNHLFDQLVAKSQVSGTKATNCVGFQKSALACILNN